MAIIFAVVGGGAVVGIATADTYSDYSGYDNYSDYDNYSNYSDAAERRRRRQEAKKNEINSLKYDINTYKTDQINGYLQSDELIQKSGVEVSVSAVGIDAEKKLNQEQKNREKFESSGPSKEIESIDKIINKIDHILQGESTDGND